MRTYYGKLRNEGDGLPAQTESTCLFPTEWDKTDQESGQPTSARFLSVSLNANLSCEKVPLVDLSGSKHIDNTGPEAHTSTTSH